MLGKIVGIVGALLMGGGVFLEWAQKEMFGMKSFQDGANFLQGKIILGLAVVGLVLLFLRGRMASVAGLAGILVSLWFYFSLTGKTEPALGVWASVGGAVILILGGVLSKGK